MEASLFQNPFNSMRHFWVRRYDLPKLETLVSSMEKGMEGLVKGVSKYSLCQVDATGGVYFTHSADLKLIFQSFRHSLSYDWMTGKTTGSLVGRITLSFVHPSLGWLLPIRVTQISLEGKLSDQGEPLTTSKVSTRFTSQWSLTEKSLPSIAKEGNMVNDPLLNQIWFERQTTT